MDYLDLVKDCAFKNVVIIDDQLSTIFSNPLVSDIIQKDNPLYDEIVGNYDSDELNTLTLEKLKDERRTIYDSIIGFYDLKTMVVMIEEMKNAGLKIEIEKDYSSAIGCSDGTIWIIDNVIDPQNPGNKNHINNAFDKFKSNRTSGRGDIFLIYSAITNKMTNFDETKTFIVENSLSSVKIDDGDVLYFNVVNKKNPIDATLLYNIVGKATQADYFKHIKRIADSSLEEVGRELWETELKEPMLYNCVSEGITNDKNLYGIVMGSIDMRYRNLREEHAFIELTKELNKFDFANIDDIQQDEYLNLRTIHELNLVASCDKIDETINELGYDVSFGDIFELGEKGIYLLVSQQCGITIRNNKRKDDFFKLIPISIQGISSKTIIVDILNKIKFSSTLNPLDDAQLDKIGTFLQDKNKKRCLKINIESASLQMAVKDAKNTKAMHETKTILKQGDKFVTIGIKKNKPELIVDDYLLDVVSFNGEKGLLVKTGDEPSIPIRKASENYIKESFNKLIENNEKLDDILGYKYNAKKEGWRRIGNISNYVCNKLYHEYIGNQTREAILVFERV